MYFADMSQCANLATKRNKKNKKKLEFVKYIEITNYYRDLHESRFWDSVGNVNIQFHEFFFSIIG